MAGIQYVLSIHYSKVLFHRHMTVEVDGMHRKIKLKSTSVSVTACGMKQQTHGHLLLLHFLRNLHVSSSILLNNMKCVHFIV